MIFFFFFKISKIYTMHTIQIVSDLSQFLQYNFYVSIPILLSIFDSGCVSELFCFAIYFAIYSIDSKSFFIIKCYIELTFVSDFTSTISNLIFTR